MGIGSPREQHCGEEWEAAPLTGGEILCGEQGPRLSRVQEDKDVVINCVL